MESCKLGAYTYYRHQGRILRKNVNGTTEITQEELPKRVMFKRIKEEKEILELFNREYIYLDSRTAKYVTRMVGRQVIYCDGFLEVVTIDDHVTDVRYTKFLGRAWQNGGVATREIDRAFILPKKGDFMWMPEDTAKILEVDNKNLTVKTQHAIYPFHKARRILANDYFRLRPGGQMLRIEEVKDDGVVTEHHQHVPIADVAPVTLAFPGDVIEHPTGMRVWKEKPGQYNGKLIEMCRYQVVGGKYIAIPGGRMINYKTNEVVPRPINARIEDILPTKMMDRVNDVYKAPAPAPAPVQTQADSIIKILRLIVRLYDNGHKAEAQELIDVFYN